MVAEDSEEDIITYTELNLTQKIEVFDSSSYAGYSWMTGPIKAQKLYCWVDFPFGKMGVLNKEV